MTRATRLASVIVLAIALGGCATVSGKTPPTGTAPVCDALVGPIKYNSKGKASRRYAGPDLAPDLAVRNRVGIKLRCPAYRR